VDETLYRRAELPEARSGDTNFAARLPRYFEVPAEARRSSSSGKLRRKLT
jgi:hypothetical protein